MKRLALPGGGFFEIQMPKGGRFVPDTNLKGGFYGAPTLSTGTQKALFIGGGMLLGGIIAWAVSELI